MSKSASSRRACIRAALGVLLVVALPRAALPVHLAEHRYTVWGEVTYEDGTPASGVTVRLTVKDGTPLGETKTDSRGRYRVLLHVHNQDLRKIFDMHVNDVSRKVRILFNPSDRATERGERIDLTVERQGEQTSSTRPAVESTRVAGRAPVSRPADGQQGKAAL